MYEVFQNLGIFELRNKKILINFVKNMQIYEYVQYKRRKEETEGG
jgi:hypothetical protein